MSKNGKHHAHEGPTGLLDPDDSTRDQPRLRRVAAKVGHGAGEVRRVAAATTAGAAHAFETADVGPELKQRMGRGASRATGAAISHPVPSSIAAAYIVGFLKGHRVARRRSKR